MDLTLLSPDNNAILEYTHTNTPVPEPASLANSYKTAAVCFLGFGECGDGSFSKSDEDFTVDTVKQCQNEGYTITSCAAPQYPSGQCPYNSNYYASCKDDTARACKEAGYDTSCNDGYIKDSSQICPYNSSYYKCKCNPCDGYTYTQAQATADGYVADGSCNSCGTTKYKRKNNPCTGFLTCECGGQIGTSTCKSGSVTKYAVCKTCCENKCSETTCPAGYVCELETCSNKYCITGCAVNYTNWCTLPITDCGTLGYTKTADQCPDGYLKCPYGDTVFCPNVPICSIGDIFYTDNSCSSAANYNSSKTVLGIVVHTTDNGKHGQIMAPWPIDKDGNKTSSNLNIKWSTEYGDISNLPNYEDYETASKDYDSCGNTDKIVAAGDASTYPAAWAVRKYAPTTDTAGKWCLPAAGIMTNIKNKLDTIQDAISKVGGVSYPSCCMWSSSESSKYFAWYSNFKYLYCLSDGNKSVNSENHVRPVLEF
ncbi:MAG: hypothetical protein KH126_08470 [Azospirillum sp.]|nr:hypothetical protein [Azospirillum sp.]